MYSYPFLVICQYLRYPSSKNFHAFKLRFKMKCTRDMNMLTTLEISRIVYVLSLSIILWLLGYLLACYRHRSAIFCSIFNELSQFPPTNCIIRYLIRPIPKFNKKLNYSMTEFCSIFYILKSMFWFYFNCFCLQLTTKLKMIKKKTHHFRVQLQQQKTVQKCKIRTVHSTFTIKQIMQLLFQIKAKCKFFFFCLPCKCLYYF